MKPIDQCLKMQERSKKYIPGMGQLLSKRPDMFSLGVWPSYYAKAKGAEIWDLDGNRYIDMSISGIGANVLGYADPDIDGAVKAAIDLGSSSSLNCAEEVELAEVMCRLHPWAGQARFARSGGEAMAVAVRIARAHTGKDKVAVCGYHGWHDWYLAANVGTENALGEHLIPGLSPVGVPKALKGTALTFRYNHLEDLKAIVETNKRELAAIVMEPIRNIQPAAGFLEGVAALAKDAGAVFIVDEISSGFRLNCGGAHLLFGVDPDIAVFSKALGNGYPIAVILGKTNVMESSQASFISSTMWTERIGPVAALAVIKKFETQDVAAHINRLGKMVQEGWAAKARKTGLDITVSGIYPLSHFNFVDNPAVKKAYFIQEMLGLGFLASNLYYPMFAHTDDHVHRYLEAVENVFGRMVKIDAKVLEEALKGKPAAAGFKRVT